MAKKAVKAADNKQNAVLGKFEGKCFNTKILNNNDFRLSDELYDNVVNSDEYKRGIEYGHYISFLGHPEDPDCQEFEHGCGIFRGMNRLDNGDVLGTVDLVNTPVGQIVKTFTDAGVRFGLSIRGMGDIEANGDVNPDTFVFRGFDLVAFPAYEDCIPEFKEIAASTDTKKKAAYKKICASVDANLSKINSASTLEVIQSQFNKDSDEFSKIQNRIDEINSGNKDIVEDVNEQKLAAVTELYLDSAERVRELEQDLADCQTQNTELIVECKTAKNKYNHLRRIAASQLATANQTCDDLEDQNYRLNQKIQASKSTLRAMRNELNSTKQDLTETKHSYNTEVKANTALKAKLKDVKSDSESDRQDIEAAKHLNLKYEHEIKANSEIISKKEAEIEDLESRLNETVVANNKLKSEASNLDAKCNKLLSRVQAAEDLIFSYQQAYANIYANALGVYLKDLPITASTSVDELKSMIKAGTSTAGIPARPGTQTLIDASDDSEEYIEESDDVGEEYADDVVTDEEYNAEMVTL